MVKLDVKKSNNLYFDHGQPQRNRISPTVRKNKKNVELPVQGSHALATLVVRKLCHVAICRCAYSG